MDMIIILAKVSKLFAIFGDKMILQMKKKSFPTINEDFDESKGLRRASTPFLTCSLFANNLVSIQS